MTAFAGNTMETFVVSLVPLVLVLGLSWLAVRVYNALAGTLVWSLSGESSNLLPAGFRSKASRYRKTADLQKIIGYLALATRNNLPLAEALRAAAVGGSRQVRTTLNSLADRLAAGTALPGAFRTLVSDCPSLVLILMQRGAECGQLAQALDDIQRLLDDKLTIGPGRSSPAVTYAFITLLFAGTVVTGIFTFVIPKFREIFAEYEVPLPALTRWLIASGPMFAIVAAVVLGLFLLGACATVGIYRERDGTPSMLATLVGTIRWVIPISRRIDYGLGMASTIRQLNIDMRAGLPIDQTSELTQSLYVTNHLYDRVKQFVADLTAGKTPHHAAGDARLGGVFISALKMIEHGQEPEPVLTHAADYYQAIGQRWQAVVTAFVGPLSTLAVGSLVATVVFALFMPLIALIRSAMEAV